MPGVRINITTSEAQVALARLRSGLADTGLAAKKTEQEIKALEKRALSQAGTEKARAGLDNLTRSLGLSRREAEAFKREMVIDPDKAIPATVGERIGFLKQHWMGLVTAAVALQQVFSRMVKPSLDVLGKLDTYTLGIATAYTMRGKFIDETTGKVMDAERSLAAAQTMAKETLEELKIANMQTMATLEQLVNAYQVTLPVAMAKGFDVKMAKDFTLAMIQAAGAIGLPFEQMGEETRSLLMGTISPRTSRIAVVLGLRNEDIRAHSKNAQELFDFLMMKLNAYKIAGVESQKTWAGMWSNFADITQQVGAKAFEPIFQMTKQWVTEFMGNLITVETEIDSTGRKMEKLKWNDDLLTWIESFKSGIISVTAEIRRMAMLLDKVGGTMTAIGSIATGGQFTSVGKKLAEWNAMFEKRYLKSEQELQNYAMKEQGLRPATALEELRGETKWQINKKTGKEEQVPSGLIRTVSPEGQILYYMKEQAVKGKYQQTPTPKDVDDKVKALIKKLQAEVDKMTLDPVALINKEAADYLKQGAPQKIVAQWKEAKLQEESWQLSYDTWLKSRKSTMAELLAMNQEDTKERDKVIDAGKKMLDIQAKYAGLPSTIAIDADYQTQIIKLLNEQKRIKDEIAIKDAYMKTTDEDYLSWLQERAKLERESKAIGQDALRLEQQRGMALQVETAEIEKQHAKKMMELKGRYGEVTPEKMATADIDSQMTSLQGYADELNDKVKELQEASLAGDAASAANLGKQTVQLIEVQEQLNRLREQRAQIMREFGDDWKGGIMSGMKNFQNKIGSEFQIWEKAASDAAQGMQDTFGDLFFDALTGECKSFGDYWSQWTKSLARAVSDALAKEAMAGILSGGGSLLSWGLGSLTGISPGTVHTGRGPYESPTSFRNVPSSIFAFAERYHDGRGAIKPGERAAIIRDDESVLTPAQMQAVGGSTTINVPVNIGEASKKQASELRSEIEDTIRRVVKRWS